MSRINLARYRMDKARENLKDAEDALARSRFSLSANRSYYAMFTAARGLLALKELDSSKHSGVICLV
ncbi:HEPN domain-containing protein [Candidatus Aerophobetes bacterium]|nr:HEPN domain-containing protein [Candidatus Aerophobetes bacterium]